MPSKLPRKESYRVTLARPEGVKCEQIRQWITEGLNAHDDIVAKVELIRGGAQEVPKENLWSFLKNWLS